MDFQDLEWDGVDYIDVGQGMGSWRALVNAVMNLGVLWNSENFSTSWGTASFSGRTLLCVVSFLLAFYDRMCKCMYVVP